MSPASLSSAIAFASASSTVRDSAVALEDVCGKIRKSLAGRPVHLAMAFLSRHHAKVAAGLAAELSGRLETEALLGCTAEGVVADDREIEKGPALSLWAACLPHSMVVPMHLDFRHTDDGGLFTGWPAQLPAAWPAGTALLVLGDPFSFPADALLDRLNEDRPGTGVFGGMASGGRAPGENALLLGARSFSRGAVAAWIQGGVTIRALVSQGCRPIGQTFVVTRVHENFVVELGGLPALVRLRDVLEAASDTDRGLAAGGLHLGLAINEYQDRFGRGDFLIRNVLGIDPPHGAIAIGGNPRVGQTVQFHVRDAMTADEDLRELAGGAGSAAPAARAALLFTCNGRGSRLFDQPHHDAAVLQHTLGGLPVAGFFAAGELGPIGGRNFVHGFTASAALFADG
jgi:small ligand-binding sensory domain FIST